jgi:hypothetical protein
VVELTHSGLNLRFDMCIVFTANYSYSERRRPRQQRVALGDRICKSQYQSRFSLSDVLIGVGVSARTCMSIYVYTVFFKKML